MRQADLFQKEIDPAELENRPERKYGGDPGRVRGRLQKILTDLRDADTLSPKDALLYRTIFPQMVGWLDKDEAAKLLKSFEREVKRLKAA